MLYDHVCLLRLKPLQLSSIPSFQGILSVVRKDYGGNGGIRKKSINNSFCTLKFITDFTAANISEVIKNFWDKFSNYYELLFKLQIANRLLCHNLGPNMTN